MRTTLRRVVLKPCHRHSPAASFASLVTLPAHRAMHNKNPTTDPSGQPEADWTESSELRPPPIYEVEEEPIERRINSGGQHVEVIDGKEVIVERRKRS